MEKNKVKRIDEIDIAKGIGILLVIIGHALSNFSYFRILIYMFHIPLFYFISGLNMKKCNYKLSEMIVCDKLLIISYIDYSLFFLLFDLIVRGLLLKEQGIKITIIEVYQFISGYGINVLWFIATLILAKFIVRKILCMAINLKLQLIIAIFMFFVGCMCRSLCSFSEKGVELIIYYPILSMIRALMMGSYVLLGRSLKQRILPKLMTSSIQRVFICAILIALLMSICIPLYNNEIIVDFHKGIYGISAITFFTSFIGISIIIIISSLVKRFHYISKFLIFFGKNSLFIMFTHEYLLIKRFCRYIVNIFMSGCITEVKDVSTIIMLVIIEIFLVMYIAPLNDKLIKWQASKLEDSICR